MVRADGRQRTLLSATHLHLPCHQLKNNSFGLDKKQGPQQFFRSTESMIPFEGCESQNSILSLET